CAHLPAMTRTQRPVLADISRHNTNQPTTAALCSLNHATEVAREYVPFLEKALCRWWLPGAGLSKGLSEDLASARNCNRQALRSDERIRGASTPLSRRTHLCLAQPLPKACQGLGESQSQRAGVPAPCLNPPHAPKTL